MCIDSLAFLTSVCLGATYSSPYEGAVPQMEDFTAKEADSQLTAQGLPV